MQGGLGIRDLAKHNKNMLLKWLWRCGIKGNGLWKKVVAAKHGKPLVYLAKQFSTRGRGMETYTQILGRFWSTNSFKVGNGLNEILER